MISKVYFGLLFVLSEMYQVHYHISGITQKATELLSQGATTINLISIAPISPGKARLSGATAELVFKSKIHEAVP